MSVNRYLGNRAGSALLRNDAQPHTPALGTRADALARSCHTRA
jgi:hypothetical protein